MKKLFVLILSILYLGSSVGATINLHFCMNKLVSWGISHVEHGGSSTCDFCGMMKDGETDNGCCKDEQRQVKLDIAHNVVQTFQLDHLISPAVIPVYFELQVANLSLPSQESPISYAPVRSWDKNLYKRICVYRI